MNEKLDLIQILKNCPKGTKLYSTVFGDVTFERMDPIVVEPITVRIDDNHTESFSADGKLHFRSKGECTLFPSKVQRDWSKFKPKKPKFDPKTLQPFDKVLVRDTRVGQWKCGFYSHKSDETIYRYKTTSNAYICCIPYNEETKHLLGTTKETPKFYRYWED